MSATSLPEVAGGRAAVDIVEEMLRRYWRQQYRLERTKYDSHVDIGGES